MPCTMPYGKAVLVALDQLGNAIMGGWPDETISSRAFRWRKNGIRKWPEKIINTIFFLDRDKKSGKRHCELSFESEREGRQMPPEMRNTQ